MQTWYNHACIIDYSILTHLTSITGRYLYLMWIEDRLEKWKWIKTNLFNKQVENIFFSSNYSTWYLYKNCFQECISSKFFHKTFLFLLLSRVREVFFRTVLHLFFLFPSEPHAIYHSFLLLFILFMQAFKHVHVCICTNLYTVYLYHHCHSRLYHICFNFFVCGTEEDRARVLASSVQSLSRFRLFSTPWTAARQVSLSITNSQSSPKLMSIESVMPSNYFILCCPLLLPSSIFPSITVFSNESALCIRWPKYWSFSFKGKLNWLNR